MLFFSRHLNKEFAMMVIIGLVVVFCLLNQVLLLPPIIGGFRKKQPQISFRVLFGLSGVFTLFYVLLLWMYAAVNREPFRMYTSHEDKIMMITILITAGICFIELLIIAIQATIYKSSRLARRSGYR